jgi:signal transduction histidine kinase
MNIPSIIPIYFFYGLAFFSMGVVVVSEGGRAVDARLRRALRPLAAFGLVHAVNEWMEMFDAITRLAGGQPAPLLFGIRLGLLAFSFLSLAAFGTYLLAMSRRAFRLSLLVPLGLTAVWAFGLLVLRNRFSAPDLWNVVDVWTRYSLAIPAALLAAIGLVIQQKVFRSSGLIKFGRDALWAAVAFGWYGIVGQLFDKATPLSLSRVVNEDVFLAWFGFPIQLFRAAMAVIAAVFVIRFLRAFQVEIDRQINALQEARLNEAEQREALRGELFQQVVLAQETERQRIARELHDETGQALTALGLGLRGLSSTLGKPNLPRARQLLKQLEGLVVHSLTELQRLISDLRPSHLDDLGLPSALRWYANDVGSRTNLKIQVDVVGKEREIQAAGKTALFRIVQEALTNVVKHSGASSASVVLTYAPDSVAVSIQDCGEGFDMKTQAVSDRTSWGLKNMRERAALLGGTFKLKSRPGLGTTVEVNLPDHTGKKERADDDPDSIGG